MARPTRRPHTYLLGLLLLLLVWPCASIRSSLRQSKPRVLRGLKGTKAAKTSSGLKRTSSSDGAPKLAKHSTGAFSDDTGGGPPPAPEATRQGKKQRTADYTEFKNFFVEQCRTDLVADVINKDDIITQGQYAQFIYDFCRESSRRGDHCSRVNEAKGFVSLSTDVQLMYVHSFCPRDMEGQVKCLNGINDLGRQYEFEVELHGLCGELEKLLVRNGWLMPEEKSVADDTQLATDDGEGDQFAYDYTDLSTESPAQKPTKAPAVPTDTFDASIPLISEETPYLELDLDAASEYVTEPWRERETAAPATRAPRPDPLEVVVVESGEEDGSASNNNGDEALDATLPRTKGLSLGTLIGITLALLVFLFFVVAFSVAIYNGYTPRKYHLRQQCFHAVSKVWYIGGDSVGKDKHRKKKSHDHTETIIASSASSDSEEIEFCGPLFESWPNVQKDNIPAADDVPDDLTDNNLYTDDRDAEANYSGSKRYSFPPRGEEATWTDDQLILEENAIGEVKKAINEGQWQDVYYLASKMASQGNIDSCDNLASAVVRSSQSEAYNNARARAQLSPEDAERAAQLDVSLAVGDWVNMAARAAVYSCLDSAASPVPSQISFGAGENDEEGQDSPEDEEDGEQEYPSEEEEGTVDEADGPQEDPDSPTPSWQLVDAHDESSSVNSAPTQSHDHPLDDSRPMSFPLRRKPKRRSTDEETNLLG